MDIPMFSTEECFRLMANRQRSFNKLTKQDKRDHNRCLFAKWRLEGLIPTGTFVSNNLGSLFMFILFPFLCVYYLFFSIKFLFLFLPLQMYSLLFLSTIISIILIFYILLHRFLLFFIFFGLFNRSYCGRINR